MIPFNGTIENRWIDVGMYDSGNWNALVLFSRQEFVEIEQHAGEADGGGHLDGVRLVTPRNFGSLLRVRLGQLLKLVFQLMQPGEFGWPRIAGDAAAEGPLETVPRGAG